MIKELQSLALNVRVLSSDEKEVLIKDIDYEINEREKAKELGLDLPVTALGTTGVIDREVEEDEDQEEPEEDFDLEIEIDENLDIDEDLDDQ